jgi:disease resistance protein RPM1
MPNLEVLDFYVLLRALKDNNSDCGNIGMEYLPSVRELKVRISCEDMAVAERDAAFAALRNACNVNPNHPTLDMHKFNEV